MSTNDSRNKNEGHDGFIWSQYLPFAAGVPSPWRWPWPASSLPWPASSNGRS